jgi:fibronectin-binding autotransporter adhesin
VRSYVVDTTVNLGAAGSLPTNFEREGIGAFGANTVVTLAGPQAGFNGSVQLFGDGTVFNTANVNAGGPFAPRNQVTLGNPFAQSGAGSTLAFVNQATIADGVSGAARSFSNSGTIGIPSLDFGVVSIRAADAANFSFSNTGVIQKKNDNNGFFGPSSAVAIYDGYALPERTSATIANNGTITGGLNAELVADDFRFTNSGTMTAQATAFSPPRPVQLYIAKSAANSVSSIASLANSGLVDGNFGALSFLQTLDLNNSGRITGGVTLNQVNFFGDPIDLTRVGLTNSGTISSQDGFETLAVTSISKVVNISNSGSISVTGTAPYLTNYASVVVRNDTVGSQTISFDNSGTITDAVSRSSAVVIEGFAITPGADPLAAPVAGGPTADVTFVNTGSITANAGATYQPLIPSPFQQWFPDIPPQLYPTTALTISAASEGASSVTFTNGASGVISATGATAIAENFPGEMVPPPLVNVGSVAFVASADKVVIANNGKIMGGAGGELPINTQLSFRGVSLDLSGQYLAGAIQTFLSVDTLTNGKGGTITGSIDLGAFDDNLQNFGTIAGNVFLRDGNDSFVQSLGGAFNGIADGGAGTDLLTVDINGGGLLSQNLLNKFVNFESTIFTGTGTVTANGPLAMNTFTLSGGHMTIAAGSTLQTSGPVTVTNVAGNNSFTNLGTITGGVSNAATFTNGAGGVAGAVGNSATASNAGTIASLANTGGAFTNSGTITGTTVNSGGTLTTTGTLGGGLTNAALINANGGALNGAVVNNAGGTINVGGIVTGNGSFTNSAASSTLNVNSGGLTVAGLLTNNGKINIARGASLSSTTGGIANNGIIVGSMTNGSEFNNTAGASVSGLLTVTGGTTTNAGQLNGGVTNVGGTLNNAGIIARGLTNSSLVNVTGGAINGGITNQSGGTVTVAGTVTGDGGFNNAAATSILNLNSGSLTLGGALSNNGVVNFNGGSLVTSAIDNLSGGVINGTLNFGNANAVLTNAGRINAMLTLGAGADQLTILPGATFGRTVDGGAGSDLLIIAAAGTDTTPDEFNLTNVAGFERTRHDSGTVALSGTLSTGTFDIAAGRLIGRTGSTIIASTVNVATGSIFGSAGTVNGNIIVNGTLSPGASPGTMNVVGNVSLAAGSVSLFELTPTVSDQLLISGTLNIAPTAILTLTGARPLTPGSSLDLIVANGGITGSFGTINKATGVFGFVAQRSNRISLLGEFLVDPTFNPQTATTVRYINAVLTSGQASAGLLAAIPSLLTAGGATNAAAFARLNPEAYASATQIGTENGLAIASALRVASAQTDRNEAGLFTFAEGLGAWRKLPGNTASGTSRGNVSSSGVLGGIGFGTKSASLGAFIGYLNGRQTIDALDARNKADGIIVGIGGHFSTGGFHASATLAYDGSSASTSRSVPGGAKASASYSMRSVTADVSMGYKMSAGENWTVKPELGFTSIWTKRGAANEAGTSPFNLAVAAGREQASFVDGTIELRREAGVLRPWLRFGVRHMLDGDDRTATALLAGATSSFTIQGVLRGQTFGTAGAGLTATVGKGVALFASYEGEFGNDATGHKVRAGLRVAF